MNVINIFFNITNSNQKRKPNSKQLLANSSIIVPFTNQKGYPMNSVHTGFTAVITTSYETLIRLSPKKDINTFNKNNEIKSNRKIELINDFTGGVTQITPIKAEDFEIKLSLTAPKTRDSNINLLFHSPDSPILNYFRKIDGLKKYRIDNLMNSFVGYRIEMSLKDSEMLEIKMFKYKLEENETNKEMLKKLDNLEKGKELSILLSENEKKEEVSVDSNGDKIETTVALDSCKNILKTTEEIIFTKTVPHKFKNELFEVRLISKGSLDFFIDNLNIGKLNNTPLEKDSTISVCSKGGDFLLESLLVFDLRTSQNLFTEENETKSHFWLFFFCGCVVVFAGIFFIFFK